MSANNDPIGRSLGLTPMNDLPVWNPVQDLLDNAMNDSAKADFELARTNLHKAINTGIDAINTLAQIADQSQQPRAYEVLAKLIESIATASKDLMELQHSIREIDSADKPINAPSTITNNLIVASTAQLQKMLKQINSG